MASMVAPKGKPTCQPRRTISFAQTPSGSPHTATANTRKRPHVINTHIKVMCCVILRKAWNAGRCCESAGRGIPYLESNSSICFTNDMTSFPHQSLFDTRQPLPAFFNFISRQFVCPISNRYPAQRNNLRSRRKRSRHCHRSVCLGSAIISQSVLRKFIVGKPDQKRRTRQPTLAH